MKATSLASAMFLFPAFAALASAADSPVLPAVGEVAVKIPSGTIVGSVTDVESFHGIPFANPPMPLNTTEVRLPPLGKNNPTPPRWGDNETRGQEDCLTVTVQRPKGTRADAKLPVLFYIFGGAFMFGATRANDAEDFIRFAEAQGQGFIFVGVNYRVGGFGFLGGAEVLEEGSTNLGLRDQRMGLEWVADNIVYFGGDPKKVTLWGQSAGSISVFDQMALYGGNATYKGNELFRSAILNSGSVILTERVDSQRAQVIFDTVVSEANCTSDPRPKLDCLRSLNFTEFYRAANSVPRVLDRSSLALSYLPRPDGDLLADSPEAIANTTNYHAVPAIITSQEDEGTAFSFAQSDVNNTEALVDYLSNTFFNKATRKQVADLVETYPVGPAYGSPFRTGLLNEWYRDEYHNGNGFKRLAALLGDFVFTLARRLAMEGMARWHPDVALWSSQNSVAYGVIPYWGTPHGTDVALLFLGNGTAAAVNSTRTYYLNFLHNQDPNKGIKKYLEWPKWTPDGRRMLRINAFRNTLIEDTFREGSYKFLRENTKALHF